MIDSSAAPFRFSGMGHFAVLQTTLDIPPVAAMQRAFSHVPFLVAQDAHTLGRDAFGILINRLSQSDARLVANCLAAEGIRTEVVAQENVPEVPATRYVKRITLKDDGLEIFDPVGRGILLGWSHFSLLTAGAVRTLDSGARSTRLEFLWDQDGGLQGLTSERDAAPPARKFHIDLIVGRGAGRFTLEPDPVLLAGALGRSPGRDLESAVGALLERLSVHAPGMWLNRGATQWRDRKAVFEYPSRNAYHEEMIWLLWQMERAGG
jgi:hypothetical protein